MKGAVLLGRVSRGERQQDPESQLAPLRAAAARHGWPVVEELALKTSSWDEAAAAQVRASALQPIVEGRADVLMIWAWDRYHREGIEGAFRELRYLEDHLGAGLFSLQEPFLSTATADKQQRELLLALVAWSAHWESQRKSDRLRAKVTRKRDVAARLGERARWGRGKLPLVSDVEDFCARRAAGATVREIAAATGFSKSTVANYLLAANFRPVHPQADGQPGAPPGKGQPEGG